MKAGSFQLPRHYMRRFLLVVATAFALLGRTPQAAEDPRLERFGDYVESLRLQTGIPGLAAAIVGNNAVLWQRAFGRQDIERSIAARTDTPFQLDGLTQVFTATMVLRCVEEGTLSLSDPVGNLVPPTYRPRPAEPGATVGQLLTHTSGPPANLVYAYRPERLEPLVPVIRTCAVGSFRKTLSNMFERLAMVDSVPGPDINSLVGPAEGIPTLEASARYAAVLQRLATPYAVDQNRRAVISPYATIALTPAGGVISTVQDLAEFVLGLRRRDPFEARYACVGVASASQTRWRAAAARLWLVRAELQRRNRRLAVRHRRESREPRRQLIVTDGDVAFAWVDADHPGEQQRVGEISFAVGRGRERLVVRARVLGMFLK